MKALSTTILIVVSAVVILIAALVVLTIFGGGMGQVTSITKFRNNCILQAKTTCSSFGTLPPTWKLEVNIGGIKTTCEKATGCNKCDCIQGIESKEETPPSAPSSQLI